MTHDWKEVAKSYYWKTDTHETYNIQGMCTEIARLREALGWKEVDRKDYPLNHEKLSYSREYMVDLHAMMQESLTQSEAARLELRKALEQVPKELHKLADHAMTATGNLTQEHRVHEHDAHLVSSGWIEQFVVKPALLADSQVPNRLLEVLRKVEAALQGQQVGSCFCYAQNEVGTKHSSSCEQAKSALTALRQVIGEEEK